MNCIDCDPFDCCNEDGSPCSCPCHLKVESIGTCMVCGYHGPGPKHDCKPDEAGELTRKVVEIRKRDLAEIATLRARAEAAERELDNERKAVEGYMQRWPPGARRREAAMPDPTPDTHPVSAFIAALTDRAEKAEAALRQSETLRERMRAAFAESSSEREQRLELERDEALKKVAAWNLAATIDDLVARNWERATKAEAVLRRFVTLLKVEGYDEAKLSPDERKREIDPEAEPWATIREAEKVLNAR